MTHLTPPILATPRLAPRAVARPAVRRRPGTTWLRGLLLVSCCVLGWSLSAWAAGPAIYLIPKGTQHLYWRTVHAGARQAADELGVRLYYRGPGEDDNRSGQAVLLRRAIDQGYAGIVLAPNHQHQYVALVAEARAKGIAVVVIDSQLQGGAQQSFVATDNYLAGRRAGRALSEALAGRGRVLLLRYLEGNASTERREQGFIDALQDSEVVIVHQGYVGASVGEALRNSLALLDAAGPLDAVFAPNESATEGVLLALGRTQRLGRIKVVGFDYSPVIWASLVRGELTALVLQQPYAIGYQGVQAVVAALNRRPLAAQIRIDSVLVDGSNYRTPRVQAIIDQTPASVADY